MWNFAFDSRLRWYLFIVHIQLIYFYWFCIVRDINNSEVDLSYDNVQRRNYQLIGNLFGNVVKLRHVKIIIGD